MLYSIPFGAMNKNETLSDLFMGTSYLFLIVNNYSPILLFLGYTIHRCGLDCRQRWHYHCVHCQSMLSRKLDFIKHLSVCKKRPFKIAQTVPALMAPTVLDSTDPTVPAPTPASLPVPTTSSAQMQMVCLKPVLHKVTKYRDRK